MSDGTLTPETPLFIVFNGASGSGDAEQARARMHELLCAANRRHEFLLVRNSRQLGELARRAAQCAVQQAGAIIAAGGDGTINAVASVALPTRRPFGIVPQGTFNYSSRAHGIPLDIDLATRALLSARIQPIQVGVVNDRIFLVNASLGLYPQLLEDREQYKRRYGRYRAVALLSAVVTLLRAHGQMLLEIEHDHVRETVRTPTLFVGNNPLQLEQAGLPEADDVQHQRLAAVIVQPVGTWALFGLAVQGAFGRLGEASKARDFAFRRMRVLGSRRDHFRRLKVATDGEVVWMKPPLEFSVAPQALLLMVPCEQEQPSA
jgi:diacylglycerol kinase family enzyme